MSLNIFKSFRACAFLTVSLWAQEEQALPQTVVTASMTEEAHDFASEHVNVVTRAQIHEMNAHNVQEVLQNIPGVNMVPHQATSSFGQISMQGLSGEYVKVLVDGIEVTGDIGGVVALDQIPVAEIERIEVVEGAASALYGTDALGGVINIITKQKSRAQGMHGGVDVHGDVLQEVESTQKLYGEARSMFRTDSSVYKVSGHWSRDVASSQLDSIPGLRLNVFPMPHDMSQSGRLSADWLLGRTNIGVAGFVNYDQLMILAPGTLFEYIDDNLSLGGSIHLARPVTPRSDLDASIAVQSYRYSFDSYSLASYNPASTPTVSSELSVANFLDGIADAKWVWRATDLQTVLVGIHGALQTLHSPDFIDTKRTQTLDAFVQDLFLWNDGRFEIVPGLRYSALIPIGAEKYDGVITPKLSTRFALTPQWTLRASYGMGYKRPTLKQKYWMFFHPAPFNFLLVGNPNLHSELSHSLNSSVEWKPSEQWKVSGDMYFNYVFNMITDVDSTLSEGFQINSAGVKLPYVGIRKFVNQAQVYTAGGDISVEYHNGSNQVGATYSRLVAKEKNDSIGRGFVDKPLEVPHAIRMHASHNFMQIKTSLRLQTTWNAPQLLSDSPVQKSPDYWMTDLLVNKDFGKHFQVFAGVLNVFDNYNFIAGENVSAEQRNQELYYGLLNGRVYQVGFDVRF